MKANDSRDTRRSFVRDSCISFHVLLDSKHVFRQVSSIVLRRLSVMSPCCVFMVELGTTEKFTVYLFGCRLSVSRPDSDSVLS